MDKEIKIEEISGVEGNSLYLIDHRISGSKPWGGGSVLKSWTTTIKDILTAISTNQKEKKKVYKLWYNGDYKITIERLPTKKP